MTRSRMARPDEPLADWCQVGRIGVCTHRAEHRHHRLMRSQGGGDEAANTLDVCAACHQLIHDRPSLAYAHGWLLRKLKNDPMQFRRALLAVAVPWAYA